MSKNQNRITSSHWGAFGVITDNGRITGVEPFAHDPDPNAIPEALPAAVHHKTRIASPSIRKGWLDGGDRKKHLRGKDEYVELPWDEALDIAAAELDRVRTTHGNDAIFGGSYGWSSAGRFHHAQGQLHRFLNSIGGYVASIGTYSTAAAHAIIPHIFGTNWRELSYTVQNTWPTIADHTETLVMFGGINPKNAMVSMGGITRHSTRGWLEQYAASGMRLVTVSPQRTDGPPESDWMPVKPGSDTALMLALAWVLETRGLANQQWLDRYSVGYEQFRPYLLGESDGQPKDPAWAAPLCGVDESAIVELAERMAKTRTLITVAWSLQRAENGEQPFWMAAVLAAMLGQIGLPGGGVGYGYGAVGAVGVPTKAIGGLAVPQGKNNIRKAIPVARITDMLMNPGMEYDYNGKTQAYPDIKLVYWCGGNPFHHHQDLNRLNKAWQLPDTIMVNEPWWTPTAKRADIVFPATTSYEREDLGRALNDSFLFSMPKFIEPVNDARDDFTIFSGLAQRLDALDTYTEGRDAEGWMRWMYTDFERMCRNENIDIPSFDELRERNWVELPIVGPEFSNVPFGDFYQDPDANPLRTPSGKLEIYSKTIEGFGYADGPAHPMWQPPEEWLGSTVANSWPLHLVSPQPGDKLHSQLESAIADRPGARPVAISINPRDAESRGLSDGDIARVFNARGACRARVSISDDILAGVVSIPTGAWFDVDDDLLDQHGNPNALTRDVGTSRIGQGPSAHSTLVQVETFKTS